MPYSMQTSLKKNLTMRFKHPYQRRQSLRYIRRGHHCGKQIKQGVYFPLSTKINSIGRHVKIVVSNTFS